MSRLDQERLEFTLKAVDLNPVIQEYVVDRNPLAEEKGLSLTCETIAALPVVSADRELVGQVLSVLVTNAINYTPSEGRVIVSTQSCEFQGKQWAGFQVSDTGPGIVPIEQDSLFTRFFRGKAGRASKQAGTGLGLAIAKEIIDRHDGRIEVVSEGVEGAGTSFNVWLPVQEQL